MQSKHICNCHEKENFCDHPDENLKPTSATGCGYARHVSIVVLNTFLFDHCRSIDDWIFGGGTRRRRILKIYKSEISGGTEGVGKSR